MRYKEGKAYPSDVYATSEDYFTDIAVPFREELRILYEAGCRNFVIDNPNFGCQYGLLDVYIKLTCAQSAVINALPKHGTLTSPTA